MGIGKRGPGLKQSASRRNRDLGFNEKDSHKGRAALGAD